MDEAKIKKLAAILFDPAAKEGERGNAAAMITRLAKKDRDQLVQTLLSGVPIGAKELFRALSNPPGDILAGSTAGRDGSPCPKTGAVCGGLENCLPHVDRLGAPR